MPRKDFQTLIDCLNLKVFRKKKAGKGREGQTKAMEWIIWKSHNLFKSRASFGAIYCHVCLFFSFKAKKVKKAALVATNAKFQNGKFVA